jgi:preprotein translocase subunit SecB
MSNANQPSIQQFAQYLKDLSFENFGLDAAITEQPGIDLDVNVEVRPLSEPNNQSGLITGQYEVVLALRAAARPKGTENEKPIFIVDVTYAGRYVVANVPQQDLEIFLLVESPRLLFPFIRQIAADAVMQGGLPPLMLAPVDFFALYQQRKAQAA